MTVIASDGKTIAADRRITSGDTIVGYHKKIHKWSRGVWASRGLVTDGIEFSKWIEDREYEWKPDKEFQAIFTEDGKLFEVSKALVPNEAFPPLAIGSGGDWAEPLLYVGYSPAQACREASKHITSCGGKIDVVRIK